MTYISVNIQHHLIQPHHLPVLNMSHSIKSNLPIVEVIGEFVEELFAEKDMAVAWMGRLLIIMKDTTLEEWAEVQEAASSRFLANFADANPNNVGSAAEEMTDTQFRFLTTVNVVKHLGRKYPSIQIIDGDGIVKITYYGLNNAHSSPSIVLDFRHPEFFDHLKKTLDYIAENPDLSQFFSQSGIASF